jgi:hypothetical protein
MGERLILVCETNPLFLPSLCLSDMTKMLTYHNHTKNHCLLNLFRARLEILYQSDAGPTEF